jgi:HK97 family phage portal protein
MGVMDKLAAWWGVKSSATTGVMLSQWSPGQPVYTPDNYEKMAQEGYTKCVWAFRAIDLVANSCAGIPMTAYKVKGSRNAKATEHHLRTLKALDRRAEVKRMVKSGELEEVSDSPILSLLKRPNPRQGGGQWMASVFAYRLIAGNTYIEKMGADTGSNAGIPLELYALRPDRMTAVVGDLMQPIQRWEYTVSGRIAKLDPANILHWKTFNPTDDIYGLPPLKAASRSVDSFNSTKDHNVALMQNGARPSGALLYDGALADNPKKNLMTQIQTMWAGARNAGKLLLFEKGMSWQQMGIKPVDLDWIEGSKLSADEILAAFGCSMILFKPTDAAFANAEAARRMFYEATILPLMDEWVDELNRWLVPAFGRIGQGIILAYNPDGIEALRENQDALYKRVSEGFTAGWLRMNDARSATGWEEDPEFGHLYHWQTEAFVRFGTLTPPTSGAKSLPAPQVKAITATDVERRRAPWIAATEAKIVERFEAERTAVLSGIAGATDKAAAIVGAMAGQEPHWLTMMEATYLAVGEAFAADTLADLQKAAGRPSTKDSRTDAQIMADLRTYLRAVQAGRWQRLQGATAEKLAAEVANVVPDEGETEAQAQARAVSAVYDRWTGKAATEGVGTRAAGIASDWVVSAGNAGSSAGASASGLPVIDVWENTGDKLVRPTHVTAGGQRVKHLAGFSVGGSRLLYPGDTSLGASSEAYACRCFVAHELDRAAL